MDKALYVAMTGARATLQAQGTVSHNLANADTAGFKAALANTRAYRVEGPGHASRIDALHVDQGFDSRVGAQRVTGNPLDVSLRPDRFLLNSFSSCAMSATIAICTTIMTASGRSAWFVGVLVMMVYLVFAVTLYLLPPRAQ